MKKAELIFNLYPFLVAIIAVVFLAIVREPGAGIIVSAFISLLGFIPFSIAKWSLFKQGKLISFGTKEMTKGYATCYKAGYILMTLGFLGVIVLITFKD